MRRPPFRVAVLVLLSQVVTFVGLLWPAAVLAADAKSVAVLIEGGGADSVAGEVQGVLPAELRIVDGKEFATALRKAGQSAPMGNTIAIKGALRDRILGRVQKAMEAVGADAAIVGRVRLGRAGREVWLVWVTAGGDVKVDEAVSLRGGSSDHVTAMRAALEETAKALVPPPPPPDPGPALGAGGAGGGKGSDGDKGDGDEGDDDKESPAPGKRREHNAGTSLFALTAAFEAGARMVAFTDAISLNIRPYQVIGAPMFHVAGEAYPAAATGIPVLKDIGVAARFSMALGLSSATQDGTSTTSNTWYRFRGGLRWRFRPGSDTGPILALAGDFGVDSFTFGDAGALSGSVPSVEYQYLRAGAEVRLPVGPVAFELSGGYRGLLGIGETGERFTDPQAMAFDAGAGFVVLLPAGFEARLSADYTRVFYAFAPVPGDAYVAGGMVDEMLGARVGVTYVY